MMCVWFYVHSIWPPFYIIPLFLYLKHLGIPHLTIYFLYLSNSFHSWGGWSQAVLLFCFVHSRLLIFHWYVIYPCVYLFVFFPSFLCHALFISSALAFSMTLNIQSYWPRHFFRRPISNSGRGRLISNLIPFCWWPGGGDSLLPCIWVCPTFLAFFCGRQTCGQVRH